WLLGDDPVAAETDLVAYATTLGRMHGATAGHVARFDEIRDALGPDDSSAGYDWVGPTFHATLDALGLVPAPSIDDDLTLLGATIASPRDFAALVHSDPCPDNWLRTGNTDRLLDFEFAGVGHALLDGAYGRVPFPTCWCIGRLPEHVPRAMERVYRTELAKGCPAARDDARYAQAMAEACAHWLVDLCLRSPMPRLLEEDFEWGTGTIRQRLLVRLDVVTQVTRDAGYLQVIGDRAEAMSRTLHDRWDPDLAPLPLYPAFLQS
ncbi:MAG: phosphotransferase, partial [Thermomicrobiales bacterium]